MVPGYYEIIVSLYYARDAEVVVLKPVFLFCRFLTMGRLISLSFGETALTLEYWQMAKELERLRIERL
uniref:Uncharacterized protein n=1 Tax=Solanum lycopersicum TaxID=4081 RepID=A0A3Q7GSM8_SOLLC